MALPLRDTQHHTYGEYLTWPGERGFELINGVAYVQEPAASPLHQVLVLELAYQIRAALEHQPWCVYIAPFDLRLPKSDEADEKIETVVQPDVLIVRDQSRIDRRGLRGAPDWLAEVLSPGTASHDRLYKVPVYERAGVPEVWLVHPADRKVSMYRLKDGRYGRPTIVKMKGQTPLSGVPGVTIDWDSLLKRLR